MEWQEQATGAAARLGTARAGSRVKERGEREADSASEQQANMLNYAYFNFELIALINTLPGATTAMSGQKALEMCRRVGGERGAAREGNCFDEQLFSLILLSAAA